MQESYQLLSQYMAQKDISERYDLKTQILNNQQTFFHSLSDLDSLVLNAVPIELKNNLSKVTQKYYYPRQFA
ncbi:hypothetical protein JCM19239_5432 [Vibrio variabilis]|uniref:Uncharacterized protein n=1 Tax=Vibrio variabilis TaxID=990271 RepID=A0ABQ0JHD0_9VIBR|nr:hypothetical protein JCM19239_5432 [Vibrio variabilis]